MLKVFLACLALVVPSIVEAGPPPYDGVIFSTTTGKATHYTSGGVSVSASSNSTTSPTVYLDGTSGQGLFVGSVTAPNITNQAAVVAALGISTNTLAAGGATTYIRVGATAGGDLTGTYPNPNLAWDRVRKSGDSISGGIEMLSGSTITMTDGFSNWAQVAADSATWADPFGHYVHVGNKGITIAGAGGLTNLQGQTVSSGTLIYQGDQNALLVGGGARFGCGGTVDVGCGVPLIGTDGRIPALTSTYFASLDASALTGSPAFMSGYLPLTAGTANPLTGILQLSNHLNAASTAGNIQFVDNFYHSLIFKATATPSGWPLGEIQWVQQGTGLHRIISFDKFGLYPGQLVLGADTTATAANGNLGVRITGNANQTPDIFVSTYYWVGIGASSPVVQGVSDARASGLYVAGPIISTASISATYGIASATAVISGHVLIGTQADCTTCAVQAVGNVNATGNGNFASITSTGTAVLGSVGIGIAGSGLPLEVHSSVTGAPNTSGSVGYAKLYRSGGYATINFGGYNGTPNYIGWMQSATGSGLQGLAINPLGGSVGVGTNSPCTTCQLEVAGNVSATGNGNFASITSTGLASVQNVQVKSIASGTQCLHADSNGNITGTGADCSSGTGASLSSTQTFSGANTFTSSATFSGFVYIATTTNAGLSYSSSTPVGMQNIQTSNVTSNGGVCIAGSTLTLNCYGMDVKVSVIGTMSNPGGNASYLGLLVNGGFGGPTGTNQVSKIRGVGAADFTIPWTPPIFPMPSGNTSVCLIGWTDAGTTTYNIFWEQLRCVK